MRRGLLLISIVNCLLLLFYVVVPTASNHKILSCSSAHLLGKNLIDLVTKYSFLILHRKPQPNWRWMQLKHLYCFYIIFLIRSHQKKIRLCTVNPMSTFLVNFFLVSTAIQRLYFILLWILISKLRVLSSCHPIPYQALDQNSEIRFPFPLAVAASE